MTDTCTASTPPASTCDEPFALRMWLKWLSFGAPRLFSGELDPLSRAYLAADACIARCDRGAPDDHAWTVLAPPPVRWFLDCGPWRPDMPLHWRIGDRSMEPLNRDPGEYSACDGSEWYHGERCPQPRPRPEQPPDT